MKNLILILSVLVFGAFAFAQGNVDVAQVEMAAGFATNSGKLVIAGDQIVFLDDTSPQYSFFVKRNQIQDVREDGDAVTVTLNQPIRDRQGERTRLAFRYGPGASPQTLLSWFATKTTALQPTTQPAAMPDSDKPADLVYEVRHKRLFGDTNGKLAITDTLIRYESTDKIEDSRNWAMRQVKEVKLNNPYELQIIPFSGDKYEFVVKGTPITGDDFKTITDRVVNARNESKR